MAIHHAAHAYGNLESLNEEVGGDVLLSDVAALNAEANDKKARPAAGEKGAAHRGKTARKGEQKE